MSLVSLFKNWFSKPTPKNSAWSALFDAGFGSSSAGYAVTTETAKTSAAVYACQRLIAESVGLMPLPIYERNAATNERERANHDAWWLLNESPWQGWTAAAFWEYVVSSKLLEGDAYARIHRSSTRVITGLEIIPAKLVTVKRTGGLMGYVVDDGLSKKTLDASDVLHFPGYGFNGLNGESVIKHAARNAIGAGIAADDFAGLFFKNGATPSMVVTFPEGVAPDEAQQTALRNQLDERLLGRANTHRPLVLVNGGKIEPISISAQDAQLLETRKFNVVEICRAFGVPPDFIGENTTSAWGTGLEQRAIGFFRHGINPHARKLEQEINQKFWPRSQKYFVEFNREGMLAGDSTSEANYFKAALGGPGAQGWMTVNEVRRIKNLPKDTNALSDAVIQSGAPADEIK